MKKTNEIKKFDQAQCNNMSWIRNIHTKMYPFDFKNVLFLNDKMEKTRVPNKQNKCNFY